VATTGAIGATNDPTEPTVEPDDEPIAEPPRIRVQGTWWRITRGATDPLFWSAEPADGRWQRGRVVRALYLGNTEETCWAEWYRHTSEAGVPPQQRLPTAIWRIEVDVDDIADLTAPGILAGEGIARLSPSRRQWPKTQPIGDALWRDGARGVLAPSAAHKAGLVLAIFRPNDGPTDSVAGVRPVGPPRLFDALPALPPGLRT
jgi:RES domain-containing protein